MELQCILNTSDLNVHKVFVVISKGCFGGHTLRNCYSFPSDSYQPAMMCSGNAMENKI